MSMKLTDTMIKVAMFLGDNGEAELSRELCAEIERLLADEREPMKCGHPKACFKKGPPKEVSSLPGYCLACVERERVREMCAEWMEHSIDRGCIGTVGECSCGLEGFLQLDLTKELAPSSREEQEEVKAPCGHSAKYLKYDKPTQTIRCQVCVNPTPWHLSITEAEAQMDEGSGSG